MLVVVVVESDPETCANRVRRRGTRADGTAQRCSDIAYRRRRAPAWALQSSASPTLSSQAVSRQSASGRDVVVVEYQFVRVSSSVLRWPEESYRPNPLVLVSITILLFLSYSLYFVFIIILIFTVVACTYFVVVFVLPRTMPSPKHSSKWV